MDLYVDTNFLTRLYLPFDESGEAQEWMANAQRMGALPLPITWLLRLELTNAFEQYVFTARTSGQARVTPELAAMAHSGLRDDLLAGNALVWQEIDMERLGVQFESLVLRHTARHGFRTYDILHVAAVLELGCIEFWSFDIRAKRLARLEGLQTN
ncbi:PIN domain-containing protein [Chthoniobacter flavus]|uniref:PIN domain-containing protein n=1 Tax=Chthoniobacter flavus TaxID=191863 RepID=UPI0005B27B4B|nr:PIN domain-containing protein [Chthoniobacter flavus]